MRTSRNAKLFDAARILAILVFVQSISASAASWRTKAPMPDARSYAAAEAINGILYVAGGLNVQETPTLQAYNPALNKWTVLATMPEGRYSGDGAGVINSRLYVAGGWDNTITRLPHNTLFLYDPGTNTWTTKSPLSHLSGCGATGVINNQLYVTTACDGFSGYRNFLDVYNPLTDTWTSLPPSSSAHAGPAAAVINGKFYVAGGNNGITGITNVLEAYDPAKKHWKTLAPMPVAVINAGSVALNGKIYVLGGTNGTTDLKTVQVYDPIKNAWKIFPASMPAARSALVAAAVDGLVFALGGANISGTLSLNQMLTVCPGMGGDD
jgi:kelch-like protein 2/3